MLEERVQHDVLGCSDCYVDPHNGHMSYCPLSMYNLFHPSNMCLAGAPCTVGNGVFSGAENVHNMSQLGQIFPR